MMDDKLASVAQLGGKTKSGYTFAVSSTVDPDVKQWVPPPKKFRNGVMHKLRKHDG